LVVADKAPSCQLEGQLSAHAWVNRARAPFPDPVPVNAQGRAVLLTYPGITTSIRFRDQQERWEPLDRHPLPPLVDSERVRRFVVLGRPPFLATPPPTHLFQDPPFQIRRPGAYEEDGFIHFVVHAPEAARVDLSGKWMGGESLPLQCTMDDSYWWARISRQQLLTDLDAAHYHGARYRLLLNETEPLQDPAAGWMDSSWNQAWSRLVQSDHFEWTDKEWRRPGWEYLTVYQLHASRFS
jgi:hypothetical protein